MPLVREGQPGRFRRLLGLKRVLAANLAVFAMVAWGFSGEFIRDRNAREEVDRLRARAEALEAKNLELAELGERYSTPESLERQARLKLNLRKPGEEVVVVREGAGVPEDGPAPARSQDSGRPRSNPQRWWHYFFH